MVIVLIVGTAAGGPSGFAESRFVGDVVAKWLPNGRDMELTQAFTFVDTAGLAWDVPKGAVVDGASIPRALWSVVGPPFTGKYRKASVVHDYFSASMSRPWRDVHKVFYEAALIEGNSAFHSKLMYGAVHAWGPRWDYIDGKPVKTRDLTVPPTDVQFKDFSNWVTNTNPSLEAIAQYADQTFPRAPVASQQNRVALVIGNSAYVHTAKLLNPSNDAGDVAQMLRELGYKVILGLDLDKASMDRHVRQFAETLAGAEAGIFFYAGHGLQVNGQNYLVPIDAKLERPSGLDFEMLRLDLVQRSMEAEGKTNVIFLDACRDNPLARNLARALGTRSSQIGRGLAPVESGAGTLISFSTQPGNVALDGTGRNSPYSEALVKHIQHQAPKDDLSSLLIAVRRDVMAATNSRQVPWEHSALTARFFVVPSAEAKIEKPEPQKYDKEMEIIFWNAVRDSKDPDDIGTYLERYPQGNFAKLAERMIARLQREARAEKALRDKQSDLIRAEEAQKFAEAKRADEQRKLDEIRRKEELDKALDAARRAQDAARIAEADRAAAIAKAAEAERVAAEARKAQEALRLKEAELRRSEESKTAAEFKRAEEQRRLEEAKAQELIRAREDARTAQEIAKVAEEQRLAALKSAEDARKSAEAAQAAHLQAQAKQQADELRRVSALALQAEQDAAIANAQRLAAAKEAEEARKAAAIAKQIEPEAQRTQFDDNQITRVDQHVKPEVIDRIDPKVLAKALQTELRRVGCDAGALDGEWGEKSREALKEFGRRTRAANIGGDPTADVLQLVVAQKHRVCPLVCRQGTVAEGGICKETVIAKQKPKDNSSELPHCTQFPGVGGKCRNSYGEICRHGGGMIRC